jgi:hypothetical protein
LLILSKLLKPIAELKRSEQINNKPADVKVYEEKKTADSLECTLCIYVAQLADNFLKKNKTEEEIEKELRLVCNFFPKKLSGEVKILNKQKKLNKNFFK